MNGTVYKRTNGTWSYQIPLGKNEEKRRVRKSKDGFKTKRAAQAARTEALAELAKIAPDARLPRSLDDYLNYWLKNHAERTCAASTVQRYYALRKHLHADVLKTPIQELTPLQLEKEFFRIKDEGGRHRKTKKAKPVSAKTVKHVAGLLGAAFSAAVRLQLMRSNPVTACKLPPQETKEKAILAPDRLTVFLQLAQGTQLGNLLELAASTGMRRGEMLALTIDDFNPDRRLLIVSKSLEQTKSGLRIKCPKNGKTRHIPLPIRAVEAIDRELKIRAEDQAAMGAAYNDQRLIFANVEGDYLRPDTITAAVCRYAKKWGFKDISLHSFRHTHGSNLLSSGIPLPAVSKRLGHSSSRVTAQVYAHALPDDEIAAADAWDEMMPIGTRPTIKTQ